MRFILVAGLLALPVQASAQDLEDVCKSAVQAIGALAGALRVSVETDAIFTGYLADHFGESGRELGQAHAQSATDATSEFMAVFDEHFAALREACPQS